MGVNNECETCCNPDDLVCVGAPCIDVVLLGGIVSLRISDLCIQIPAGTDLPDETVEEVLGIVRRILGLLG
ncbi:hypothetical protein [Halalkalibacter lacteus]|uniref:hypothetical protein n=1 Tax=Halalkalibacter lacteus TaxID=3090663 RepID=UPI002FCA8B0A